MVEMVNLGQTLLEQANNGHEIGLMESLTMIPFEFSALLVLSASVIHNRLGTIDLKDKKQCQDFFDKSRWFFLYIFIAIWLAKMKYSEQFLGLRRYNNNIKNRDQKKEIS